MIVAAFSSGVIPDQEAISDIDRKQPSQIEFRPSLHSLVQGD